MASATKRTGQGHGGSRAGAGRPRGSKTKVYRPHLEKLMALNGGPLPRDIMLAIMRQHFKARRYDEAARVAAMVAPFCHPRLSSSNVTIKPSLREMLMQATDEELAEFAEEAEHAAGLAGIKPKGTA